MTRAPVVPSEGGPHEPEEVTAANYRPHFDRTPTSAEAAEALALPRRRAGAADPVEVAHLDPGTARLAAGQGGAAYPDPSRIYPETFRADEAYRGTLPDLQNGPASMIRGARAAIQHVGISNFRLQLRHRTRDCGEIVLESSVTGTVSLEADHKGINMSRIVRSFYAHADRQFGFDMIDAALDGYRRDLGSFDARNLMKFSYPMQLDSLRSGLTGWQYYDAAMEVVEALAAGPRVGDFRVVASDQENLHSHDAVSVLTEGPTFAAAALDPHLFATLHHRG